MTGLEVALACCCAFCIGCLVGMALEGLFDD